MAGNQKHKMAYQSTLERSQCKKGIEEPRKISGLAKKN